jgi:hypothetical protein
VNIPTALTVSKTNWIGQPIITERQYTDVCYIEMGGIIYNAATDQSSAVLGSAPGLSPAYHGRLDKRQGLALVSQTELNQMVGDLYAFRNSRYPDVQLKMRSNYANLDIAPPEKLLLNVASNDTPRRITWTNKAFAVTGISWERDEKQQIELPTVTLAELPDAWTGSTIEIPIDPPTTTEPPRSNQPPRTSVTPPAPTPTPVTYLNGMVAVYTNGTFVMNTAKLNFVGNVVQVEANSADSSMADIMFDACGCSGSFIPNGGTGIYGEMTLQSSSFVVTKGGGSISCNHNFLLFGAELPDHFVWSDSSNFFDEVTTTATIVIPYAGKWNIQLKNFYAWSGVEGFSSADVFSYTATTKIDSETLVSTGSKTLEGPYPDTRIGTLVGSDYIWEITDKYFAQGQKIIISNNVALTGSSFYADHILCGWNPGSRVIIYAST